MEYQLFGAVYTLLLVNNNMYSGVPVVWGCVTVEYQLFGAVYTLLLVNNNMYSGVPVVWGCVHTVVSKQ